MPKGAFGSMTFQPGIAQQAVLPQLHGNEPVGEAGGVYRRVHLGKHEWQCADVVLVAVGDEEGLDFFFVLDEVGDVGDDQVDAGRAFTGEHDPRVDDDNLVIVLKGHHVLADFP